MKKIAVFIFAVFLVFLCGCEGKAKKDECSCLEPQKEGLTLKNGILKIGIEYGYPPFEYLAEDGKTLIGFDVDMADEICRRLNLKPEYIDTQWAGIFEGLATNRYDILISAATIIPEREKHFWVTRPYVKNSECLIVNSGMKNILDKPEKLKGLKVACQEMSVSSVFVHEELLPKTEFEVFEYDKLLDAFEDLKLGRVDVVVAEAVASKNIVKNSDGKLRVDWYAEESHGFGMMVNKKNKEFFDVISRTLDDMYSDGFMKSIEDKYF